MHMGCQGHDHHKTDAHTGKFFKILALEDTVIASMTADQHHRERLRH